MTYQIFGSPTSQDYDVIVFVHQIGTIQENKAAVHAFEQKLQSIYSDKPLNINIAIVKEGILVDCFKGLSDELNNSLFDTYECHPQAFPNHIQGLVKRDVAAKILRAVRVVTSHLSRTTYRVMVKKALKSNLKAQLEVLQLVDFRKEMAFQKGDSIEIYKSIAFQTGQTLALMHGIECFSKKEIIHFMHTQNLNFEPFLKRVPSQDFKDLQKGITNLINCIIEQFEPLYLYNESTYHQTKSIK